MAGVPVVTRARRIMSFSAAWRGILPALLTVSSLCNNATFISGQVDTMLAEYDRETPPSSKVVVTALLDIRHVTVYDKDSTVHVLGDLKMEWEDKRISWNATEWNCDNPLVTAERLWLPDVTLMNAAGTSNGDMGLRARLSSTGAIAWITRLDFTIPVSLVLDKWPNDVQTATVKFGSRAYSIDEMDLETNHEKRFVAVVESSSWEIMSLSSNRSIRDTGVFQTRIVSWTFTLRRRAPAHALATAGVLVAVLILLTAAGALKPALRAPASACASFTSAMWLISALLRLPAACSYPRVVSLMSATCICGAITTLAAAVVGRIATKTSKAPGCVRSAVLSISLRCSLTPDVDESNREKNGTWCLAAVILDRVFVVALWFTLFILAILYVA
ncbi:hypothetical protein K1T71_008549 [Dendrolimus kikuchii]|uniref:Uncharacterized protein n=1 Tax=Dendrolimus kikuchii TaxID=765133 RepID=A0ACC1CV34_9NEOP|nr:hypothetical protein K1T71_008549 [Dendrolimus kikuchii]